MSTLAAIPAAIPLYAGFWRRFAAAFVDSIVLVLPNLLVGLVMPREGLLLLGASLVIACTYYACLHASRMQATLGKRLFGIKVTDMQGMRIGLGRAVGRYLAMFLSTFTLAIGYLMAAFTGKRQALHDLVSSTVVVHRDASEADVQAGGGVMPVTGGVIAVALVLFALPFFGGIVAAIAIPAYQDYTIRAKVGEVFATSAPLRSDIERALVERRPVSAGLLPAPTPFVKSVAVLPDGRMLIALAPELATSGTLMFTPVQGAPGTVAWKCEAADIPDKFLPASCRS